MLVYLAHRSLWMFECAMYQWLPSPPQCTVALVSWSKAIYGNTEHMSYPCSSRMYLTCFLPINIMFYVIVCRCECVTPHDDNKQDTRLLFPHVISRLNCCKQETPTVSLEQNV